MSNTLEDRASALETQLKNKTLEQHFREYAELIDGLLESRLDAKFDVKLEPIRRDLAVIKHAVNVIAVRLT